MDFEDRKAYWKATQGGAYRPGSDYLFDVMQEWGRNPSSIPGMNEWQRNMLMQYFTSHPLLQLGRGAGSKAADKLVLRNLFEMGVGEDDQSRPPDWLAQLAPRMTGKVSKGLRGEIASATVPDPEMMIGGILGSDLPPAYERAGWEESQEGLEAELFGELVGRPLTSRLYRQGNRGGLPIARARSGKREPWKGWTESQKRLAPPLYDYLWDKDQMAHQQRLGENIFDRANEETGLLNQLIKYIVKAAVMGGMPGLGSVIGGGFFTGPGGLGQPYDPQAWAAQQPGGGMDYSPGFLGGSGQEDWLEKMHRGDDWDSYNWGGY